MAFEDIQSPLPPRRVSTELSGTTGEPAAGNQSAATSEQPAAAREEIPRVTTVTSMPAPKKSSGLKIMPILGIAALVVTIIFLITKVLIPAIKGGGGSQVTLTYWGLWEDPATIQGIIADYEAKNPKVKINYVRNEKVNYRTRLASHLNTGGAGEVDMFRVHASWIPMFSDNLARVPAATAQAIGLDTDYYDAYKADLKVKGSYVGVPLMYDGLSLFYNKDLVESGQVDLPKSWWDLEQAANKLTVRDNNGNVTVAGAALGLTDNVDQWSDIVGLMLKQAGVNVLSADADNEKKLKDVLTFYSNFRTKDHVWDEQLPASTQLFANGKLAFYFAPSWRVFNIEDMKIPTLKYDITTVPQLPTLDNVPMDQANDAANLTNIHWSTYWFEGVNNKSKYQKEAWDFLSYLSTKESLEKMYTAASQVRSFGEIYPRKSMADKMAGNNLTRPFTKVANDASTWYLSSRTFDDGLNDEMSKYFGDAINGMALKALTPEVIMPDLRNGINQLIQKYGLTK